MQPNPSQKICCPLDCHHVLSVLATEVSSEIALRCDVGGADWAVCGPCMPSSAGILRACEQQFYVSLRDVLDVVRIPWHNELYSRD